MTMRVVGGFLPLRLPAQTPVRGSVLSDWIDGRPAWLLRNARSALNALWRLKNPRRVWLPAYICRELPSAVPAHVELVYYALNESLQPRVELLACRLREGDHVVVVAYFGRHAGKKIRDLAGERADVTWIEDRAQSLEGRRQWANFVIYSPRKLFGVPDGGVLVANSSDLPELVSNVPDNLSFVLPVIERFEDEGETDNARWYASYVRGEREMSIATHAMTRLSRALLGTIDLQADVASRKANYRVLYGLLSHCAFFELSDPDFGPMGFPVRVASAASLAANLAKRGIFAARHWVELPSNEDDFGAEHRLSRSLLTLPCDYRYDEGDMRRVGNAVLDLDPAARH